MYVGKLVFAQVMEHLPPKPFDGYGCYWQVARQ